MILIDHFNNLQKVTKRFDFILAVDDVAHFITPSIDESENQIDENIFFINFEKELSIFKTFVDDDGVTQFIFARPFDTDLYYISNINRGYDKNDKPITDAVIFQLVCGDMED